MVDIPDAISLTLLLTYLIPIVLTCYNTKYFVLFVALVFVWLSVEAIKPFVPSARPPGATKCDRWCLKGPVGGQPGFPSGHMASIAVLVALLYYHFPSPLLLIGGLVWLIAMAYSRYVKQCHTPFQIAAGAVYGLLSAYGFIVLEQHKLIPLRI